MTRQLAALLARFGSTMRGRRQPLVRLRKTSIYSRYGELDLALTVLHLLVSRCLMNKRIASILDYYSIEKTYSLPCWQLCYSVLQLQHLSRTVRLLPCLPTYLNFGNRVACLGWVLSWERLVPQ